MTHDLAVLNARLAKEKLEWLNSLLPEGCAKDELVAREGPSQHYYDLGLNSKTPCPDSNEPLCVLNRLRGLTLPRHTVTPTATSSAQF